MTRVDPKKVDAMIEESKVPETPAAPATPAPETKPEPAPAEAAPASPFDNFVSEAADVPNPYNDSDESLKAEPIEGECTIDDFCKVDMRVARILTAEAVKEAKKLLKLTLNLGGNNNRQVFAGIKAAYTNPEELVGRLVICVANLKPRKMKFGMSEAMVGAAGTHGPGSDETQVFLLSPDSGAKPGQRVH